MFSRVFARPPEAKSDRPMLKSAHMSKKGPQYQYEISGILEAVKQYDLDLQGYVLRQLRITPIWFDHFYEIPELLHQLMQ
jgi:hypothetical protein